ncbi:Uncharacterized protein GBIM_16182 [Gryllus bimaculatus]|nr:Uncharacterized protein GBIM_16182 [Gryllus bimaculatus]
MRGKVDGTMPGWAGGVKTRRSTGNILSFCDVGLKISGVVPISSHAALHLPNTSLTAVAAATTERHTVAFLGTSDGVIKKAGAFNAVLLPEEMPWKSVEYLIATFMALSHLCVRQKIVHYWRGDIGGEHFA